MTAIPVAKSYSVYYADGRVGVFVAASSLGAAIKARKAHSSDVVYTVEGTEPKYQYNGYGWDNIEAAAQRNNSLLEKAQILVDVSATTSDQFWKCCELYVHLINASIANLEGQWFIIDAVLDPLDYYHTTDMAFAHSTAIYLRGYDEEQEDMTLSWADVMHFLINGSLQLMKVQPMKVEI